MKRGFTLVELLMAAVILGILTGMLLQRLGDMREHQYITATYTARDEELAGLISNISSNVGLFDQTFVMAPPPGDTWSGAVPCVLPVNYPSQNNPVAACMLAATIDGPWAKVPIVWSKDYSGAPANCDEISCPGRMAYTIQPMEPFPGLFVVTVWVRHPSIAGKAPREYKFVTSFK